MTITLPDQAHRAAALDTQGSFIVQAPAGSGKTELLTLRYLSLLAQVDQPEEILAITFTKKAASEMRDRIVRTLVWAQKHCEEQSEPEPAFEKERLNIARAVLQHNNELNWHLLENPSRLRVQTIDSFCFYLASQLPVLSRIGGDINISEDVSLCFNDAINSTLDLLETEDPLGDDIAALLTHLDNNQDKVVNLLTNLLVKRDQWLTYALEFGSAGENAKRYLHESLDGLISEKLTELHAQLTPYSAALTQLLNFSTSNLIETEKLHWPEFEALNTLPEPDWESIKYWQRIPELLLTNAGTWRKAGGISVRNGFPPADSNGDNKSLHKQRKTELAELIGQLQETPHLAEALQELRMLPAHSFADQQWQILEAILRILARLSMQLLLSFRKFRLVDYSQTSAAALQALGDSDAPTDIALALDNKLQHILVDEFQDTSRAQLQLLERLIDGWLPDDGRTLFLVGDAMQSCYSFRNANVGIYLDVRQRGIGQFPLQTLDLSANFRSQSKIVSWVNTLFSQAFPENADSSRGAVPYSMANPVHDADPQFGIGINLIRHGNEHKEAAKDYEAQRVIEHVQTLQQSDADASIAILARSRSHFTRIIAALEQASIAWQATDIDRMASLGVIEDALSLTRAVLNKADRLAWLGILRAPWVGLKVNELLIVTRQAEKGSIWQALLHLHDGGFTDFTADTRQRLQDFVKVMRFAIALRYRKSLRQLIEASWTLLRGIDCCESDKELDSIAHYFSLLEHHEKAGGLANFHEFEEIVRQSFVPARHRESDTSAVQLLTMHKAKGLEYDHVILPCLAAGTARDSSELLRWHERLDSHGESRLFLAALTATGADDDPLYQLLKHEARLKAEFESTRLLYIAVTRACKSALLLATVQEDDKSDNQFGVRDPINNSLLARIWPHFDKVASDIAVSDLPAEASHTQAVATTQETTALATQFNQLDRGIALPTELAETLARQLQALADETASDDALLTDNENTAAQSNADRPASEEPERDPVAAMRGILIHSAFEAFVADPQAFRERLHGLRDYWEGQLCAVVGAANERQALIADIEQVINKCLSDGATNWIFDNQLTDHACELRLCYGKPEGLKEYVVDRTFVDADGVRWIIDYKSSTPRADQTSAQFVSEQIEKYRGQLRNYQFLFSRMEDKPVKTALYLTALQQLEVVTADLSI